MYCDSQSTPLLGIDAMSKGHMKKGADSTEGRGRTYRSAKILRDIYKTPLRNAIG